MADRAARKLRAGGGGGDGPTAERLREMEARHASERAALEADLSKSPLPAAGAREAAADGGGRGAIPRGSAGGGGAGEASRGAAAGGSDAGGGGGDGGMHIPMGGLEREVNALRESSELGVVAAAADVAAAVEAGAAVLARGGGGAGEAEVALRERHHGEMSARLAAGDTGGIARSALGHELEAAGAARGAEVRVRVCISRMGGVRE